MNKPILSLEELKLILVEMFNLQYRTNQRTQDYIRKVLGDATQKEDPMSDKLRNKIINLCSSVIAGRLKRNRRNVHMISRKDLKGLIPLIVEGIEQEEDFKFDYEERRIFEKSIEMIFREFLSLASDLQLSYAEYWRRVLVVVKVAHDEGVHYPELFSCDEYVDEVMRGWLSREEFIIYYGKVISKLSDIKEVSRVFMIPMLEALSITDARERRKVKREFEEHLTPIIEAQIKKIREVLPCWIRDEVARIYLHAEEHDCTQCAQSVIVPEIPGQYRDFDADMELHGTVGIPLCSSCLGTGRSIASVEFSTLKHQVSMIRTANLGIQAKAAENSGWRIQVEANNERLVEIARRALEIVKQPNKKCLAMKLINGEW
jgi:hypothetical protein